ncbi:MAG: hypothetical protein CL678_13635 [Bdellovibrionaceae bacterium]|nr:hypothetical protein [Pseudobdellovibrionaceae bacterium]|tara:strand:- start:2089 stop:4092 length:2004 start_codon:yes stop_codon:yes gene_type:complete
MMGENSNHFPIQCVFHYWETPVQELSDRLDALSQEGVHSLSTFIPWQVFESDLSQRLTKFLQATALRNIQVQLLPMPELGLHYPYSGFPRDLISNPEVYAKNYQGHETLVSLPPNVFALPSLFSEAFSKRFYNYQNKFFMYLGDLEKNQPEYLDHVEIQWTGSLWKYYRAPRSHHRKLFSGFAGDRSRAASIVYRKTMDRIFQDPEFSDGNRTQANQWKTQSFETVNRQWFYQLSEERFRNKGMDHFRRLAPALPHRSIELYIPEADPVSNHSNFLQMVSGSFGDVKRISTLLNEYISRATSVDESHCPPFVYFPELGGFQKLKINEKQFLLMKALLLFGGRGGGVFIDVDQWIQFSQGFRKKVESLGNQLAQRKLRLKNRAIYLTTHTWSPTGILWDELEKKIGKGLRLTSSFDLLEQDQETSLCVIDPSLILTRERLEKLLNWMRCGRALVLSQSALMTADAKKLLDQKLNQVDPEMTAFIEGDLPYHVHGVEDGTLIQFSLPQVMELQGELLVAWRGFVNQVLNLSGLKEHWKIADARIEVIPMSRAEGSKGLSLFVLNPSERQITADLFFDKKVEVLDFQSWMNGQRPSINEEDRLLECTLDIPPKGILPLGTYGIDWVFERKVEKALKENQGREKEKASLFEPLPGYQPELNFEKNRQTGVE